MGYEICRMKALLAHSKVFDMNILHISCSPRGQAAESYRHREKSWTSCWKTILRRPR